MILFWGFFIFHKSVFGWWYWIGGIGCRILKWLKIVFIFPNKFYKSSYEYNLVHLNSMKFTTEIIDIYMHVDSYRDIFPKTLLLCQPYDTFSCALKIGNYIVLLRKQVGEIFSNLYYTCRCYQEWSKYKFKKVLSSKWKKKLLFDYCFLNFLPSYRIFLICIHMRAIVLNCHWKC